MALNDGVMRGRGSRSSRPRSDRENLLVQTSMCTETWLSRCLLGWVPWVVEDSFVGYKGIQGGFEGL
jgi:hypothetical protein